MMELFNEEKKEIIIDESKPEDLSESDKSAIAYLEKYKARVKMWNSSHPMSDLPLINTPDGPRWLNRAERRKLKSK